MKVHTVVVLAPNIFPALDESLQVSSHGRVVLAIHVDQVEVARVVNRLHDIRTKRGAGGGEVMEKSGKPCPRRSSKMQKRAAYRLRLLNVTVLSMNVHCEKTASWILGALARHLSEGFW